MTRNPSTHEAQLREVRKVASDRNWCACSIGNIVVASWFLETGAAEVATLSDLVHMTSQRFPNGIGLVQVISLEAQAPSNDVRNQLIDMLRNAPVQLKGSSIVVPHKGFRFAAARAMVATLALLARPNFPHLVHPSVSDAVQWLSKLLRSAGSPEVDSDAVIRAIEGLKAPAEPAAIPAANELRR